MRIRSSRGARAAGNHKGDRPRDGHRAGRETQRDVQLVSPCGSGEGGHRPALPSLTRLVQQPLGEALEAFEITELEAPLLRNGVSAVKRPRELAVDRAGRVRIVAKVDRQQRAVSNVCSSRTPTAPLRASATT